MTKKDTNEIIYYIEDANLFTLWVFSYSSFYPKEYFDIDDISPLRTFDSFDYKRVFNFLSTRLKMAEVNFPKSYLYNDVPPKEMILPIRDEELKDYPTKDVKEILDTSKKLIDKGVTLEEIELLETIRPNIRRYLYLQPDFSLDDRGKLKAHLDQYIELFLNNELYVYDRNYLAFEKQKQTFIGMVKKMSALEKYGTNFVISYIEGDYMTQNDNFLFVHTLYALQKLGYIGVLRLWYDRDNIGNTHTYYANIVVFDSFIDEVNENFRKNNPATVFESYDPKTFLLKFFGKTIELSKKKKETDAVLLMKTLCKEPDRFWFSDEILTDWGYQPEDERSKNKAYFAARKINEAVQKQTSIDDFIDHNTSKFRINPKYLKS